MGDTGAFGWDMPTMNFAVTSALAWTTTIAAFLVATFIGLKLGIEYFKYKMSTINGNEVGVVWDWMEIMRVMLLLLLIGAYYPLADGITSGIKSINEITHKSSDMNQNLTKIANDHYVRSIALANSFLYQNMEGYRKTAEENGHKESVDVIKALQSHVAYSQFGKNADGTPTGDPAAVIDDNGMAVQKVEGGTMEDYNWVKKMCVGILSFFAFIIKVVMGMFLKIVFMVGVVFGPIVLALSIFFKDKLMSFFNSMLTIGFAFTTLNILDMIVLYFEAHYMSPTSSVYESAAFSLIMIGCYFNVFKITSWFIGSVGMNSIMSSGMGKIAAVGAVAAMALTKGKSAMVTGGGGGKGSQDNRPD